MDRLSGNLRDTEPTTMQTRIVASILAVAMFVCFSGGGWQATDEPVLPPERAVGAPAQAGAKEPPQPADGDPEHPAASDATSPPIDRYHQASREVTRRLQELRRQLTEATEAGKQELAARIRQEIADYVSSKTREQMEAAREQAEKLVKQQYEQAEQRIEQLREQGGEAISQAWRSGTQGLVRSHQLAARARDLRAEGMATAQTVQKLLDADQLDQARQQADRLTVTLNQLALTEQLRRNQSSDTLPWEQREQLQKRLFHLRAAAASLVQLQMYDAAQQLQQEAVQVQRVLEGQAREPGGETMPPGDDAVQRQFRRIDARLEELSKRLDQLADRLPPSGEEQVPRN